MRVATFKLEGYDQFPLDMLRYDACWPMDQDSIAEMQASFDVRDRVERRKERKPFKVTINTIGVMTPARWSSFGWRIVK
jgi:hypothetical protein